MFRSIFFLLSFIAFFVKASPYDSLAAALTQQQLVNDLRARCDITADIPDEKVRSVFTASKVNHHALSAAASALQKGKKAQYQQQMNAVRCPEFSKN